MARFAEPQTSATYAAAERFRDQCLLRDGSLLFDDAALWTPANLDRLQRVFVETPDEGDRSFTEKFRDQLQPADQSVKRLAAESVAVYFLFPSNVSATRKFELVREVLSWAGDDLASDHPMAHAFEKGIGSGGQGYNTRRPFELSFLIALMRAWKKLGSAERTKYLADPWSFEGFVDELDEADSRQIRHMLLHLLFPEHFERIASRAHKRQLLETFGDLVPVAQRSIDQRLYAIRKELEKLDLGPALDFYEPPLSAAWWDEGESSTEFAPLDAIRHKKQIVLYGPPGTGKTFRAKRLAEHIIRSAALATMRPARYFSEQKQVQAAVASRIHRLQLHPSYSYEDFIRGLHVSASGATEYRPGYLMELVRTIEQESTEGRLPHVLILDEINRTDLTRMLGECFTLLEDRGQTIQLPGRSSDGRAMTLRLPADLYVIGTMNLIDQSIEQIDFALRRRFLWILCGFDAEALLAILESSWGAGELDIEWERVEPDFQRLVDAASALNDKVRTSPLLGPQYEVGHTYLLDVVHFLRHDLGPHPKRRQNFLWSKRGALPPVERLWRLSLAPLLNEYLSGLEARVRRAELDSLETVFLEDPKSKS